MTEKTPGELAYEIYRNAYYGIVPRPVSWIGLVPGEKDGWEKAVQFVQSPLLQEIEILKARLAFGHAICPCTLVEPCSPHCTCADPMMSGGCSRCCSYGSKEQQIESAKQLSETDR